MAPWMVHPNALFLTTRLHARLKCWASVVDASRSDMCGGREGSGVGRGVHRKVWLPVRGVHGPGGVLNSARAEILGVFEVATDEHRRLQAMLETLLLVTRALSAATVDFIALVMLSTWNKAPLEVLRQVTAVTPAILLSLVALKAVGSREGLEVAMLAEGVDLIDPAGVIWTKPWLDAVCLVKVDTLALFELIRTSDRHSGAILRHEWV